MLDVAPSEFLLVAIVALLVIGPKDLPKALRVLGYWVGRARGVARQFRSGFDSMVREAELAEMEKKWADENARILAEHPATPEMTADPVVADATAVDVPAAPVMVEKPVVAAAPVAAEAAADGRGAVMSDAATGDVTEIDASRAPLLDHLIELRRRLLWSLGALVLAFGGALYFARPILTILVAPLHLAGQKELINTDVYGGFLVEVKVAFFAGMMVAFPVIANQIWRFVAPGLYRKEKRALLPFLMATPVLFSAGAALAYFLAIPLALKFLLGFQGDLGGITQRALPDISSYLKFVMQFLFGFGLAFLLPVLLMLLEAAGIVTRKQLVGARRYAIVANCAVAAVLTPPDVGSMLLLAIPLVTLYELALVGIWFTERKRAKEAATDS